MQSTTNMVVAARPVCVCLCVGGGGEGRGEGWVEEELECKK